MESQQIKREFKDLFIKNPQLKNIYLFHWGKYFTLIYLLFACAKNISLVKLWEIQTVFIQCWWKDSDKSNVLRKIGMFAALAYRNECYVCGGLGISNL